MDRMERASDYEVIDLDGLDRQVERQAQALRAATASRCLCGHGRKWDHRFGFCSHPSHQANGTHCEAYTEPE